MQKRPIFLRQALPLSMTLVAALKHPETFLLCLGVGLCSMLSSCRETDSLNVFITNDSDTNISVLPAGFIPSGSGASLVIEELSRIDPSMWFKINAGNTYRYDIYDLDYRHPTDTLKFIVISEEVLNEYPIEEIAANEMIDTILNAPIADFKDNYLRLTYVGKGEGNDD